MCEQKPSYSEMEARLDFAESAIAALRGNEVDVVVGESDVAYVRLRDVEDALREANERLHDVLRSIGDAFVAVDSNWRVTFVNAHAAAIAGRESDELTGEEVWKVFPDLQDGNVRHRCEVALERGEPCHVDAELADHRWLSVSAYPATDGASIHWRDITLKKREEREREAQRELLEKLVNNASFGIAVINRSGQILLANPAFQAFPHIADGPVIGGTILSLFPRETVDTALSALEVVIDRGERLDFTDYKIQPPTGEPPTYWDAQIMPLFEPDGSVESALVLVTDVTEAVQSRLQIAQLAEDTERNLSQLQAVLNNMDQGLLIFGRDRSFIMANPAVHAMLPGIDQHLGQTGGSLPYQPCTLNGDPVPDEERPISRLMSGERFRDVELVVVPEAGTASFVASFSGSPVQDENGQPNLWILGIRDVTERVMLQEQLRGLNQELERQVAERTQLAERRATLLQTTARELLHADQRARRRLSSLLHDHLQQLLAAGHMRAQGLVARVDADQQETMVELVDILAEAVNSSRTLAVELSPPVLDRGLGPALKWLGDQMRAKHHLKVEVTIEDDVEPDDHEMGAFLLQAAPELLFNVVKHSGTDEASVRLAPEDGGVVLEVTDSGEGFEPSVLEAEGDGEALGSGLLGIRRRLELLGGRMEIESRPGEGAAFALHAPVSVAAAPTTARPTQIRMRLPADARQDETRPVRILVVDDHHIVREGLVGLLSGYPELDVLGEACDGATAVAMARELKPDVVLMDVTMPGMSGIEATRKIVSENPSIRVVGLSMHEERDVADQMLQAGADAYVTKGGPYEDLLTAICGEDFTDEDEA